MADRKKPIPKEKDQLHPLSKHRGSYNFPELIVLCPELGPFLYINQFQNQTIDFKNPHAVKALNKALLKYFYNIKYWDIPEGYLCPPVPGRADYIHYAAGLLAGPDNVIPRGKNIRVLDIGTGANCIYSLLGHAEYGWSFVGSEIDSMAIRSAKNLVEANSLAKAISIRKQSSGQIFEGVIHHAEKFDLTICNPPFHSSLQEATAGTDRKWKNLGYSTQLGNNFGGKDGELWCEGGELCFVSRMIGESVKFARQVKWFSSLISKKETLTGCYSLLRKENAAEVRTINMSQGQKISRILAWRFDV